SSPVMTTVDAMSTIGSGNTPTAQLTAAVEHLRTQGFDVLAADLTTPDVEGTVHVVRAIVPGLQPIGFGRDGLRLGGRRLYEAPARMGYRDGVVSEDALNPDPHCFP